jgi:iron complex outermembrane receptor protein
MFRRTKVCSGVLVALGGALSLGSAPVFGQQPQTFERVEITGSSVRRIDAESALPVTVLRKEDIERTGATSVVDLLQKLPTVQGSTGESASVGGGSFGFSGVSIHNIGETRTLVLLNGHRLTQFGGQSLTGFAAAMDLNAIPITAIERVEILSDGASALYGADAIAGVVNFITKRNTTEGDVTVGLSHPQHGGAEEQRFSISKGFGSLDRDGWNIFGAYAYDKRKKLDATDRDYASTGRVFFSNKGQNYRFQQYSASPIPANATDDLGQLISPYLIANCDCPANTFRVTDNYTDGGQPRTDDYCGFDFVSTLEIYPVRERNTAMASADLKLGDHNLFAEVLWSNTKQTSRIAPVPGGILIEAGTALHDQYLAPIGITGDSIAFYRISDLGKRTNKDEAKFYDVALGSKGTFMNWDYRAAYTHSVSDVKGNISGYPGALAIGNLTSSGLLNPFVGPGQQSPEANEALAAVNYNGYWDGGVAKLDTLSVNGSREIMKLPSGPLMLGLGASWQKEKFESKPSAFAQGILADPVAGTLCDPDNGLECDQRFGDASSVPPYKASRDAWGLFGELVIPAMKDLEVNLGVRYDHYSDFGGTTNAKASFRYNPVRNVLVRGSYGTGFHAPTVPQINAAQQSFGVTSDNYTCTPELQQVATSFNAQCQPGNRQYDQLAGGNPDLKPEKSRNATFGLRYEPTAEYSLGADFWWVAIKDAFGQLTEQEVFANPLQYSSSWGTATDVGTGVTYLAFLANNQNLGKQYSSGIDFDLQGRWRTPIGQVNSQILATYMLREVAQLQKGGEYFSAIADNGELGAVTFRWQGRWTTALVMDKWTHTLGFNYKSGYRDQLTTVDVLDTAGNVTGTEDIRLKVKDYYTFDLQTQWRPIKQVVLTLGILNLFDKDPPFTLSTGGINKGQQFGYDDRYYDPRGRTLYGNASYKF